MGSKSGIVGRLQNVSVIRTRNELVEMTNLVVSSSQRAFQLVKQMYHGDVRLRSGSRWTILI